MSNKTWKTRERRQRRMEKARQNVLDLPIKIKNAISDIEREILQKQLENARYYSTRSGNNL